MNKGNDQIRETIGTELQNKAETVVSITVDPANKDISIVKAEYCRDKEFEPFAFSINESGLPFIIEDWHPDQRSPSRKGVITADKPKKPIITNQFTEVEHRMIVRRMFTDVEPEKYAQTWQRLKRAANYFGHSVADNSAKELLNYYQDLGFVRKSVENGRYLMSLSTDESADGDTTESADDFPDKVPDSIFSEVV